MQDDTFTISLTCTGRAVFSKVLKKGISKSDMPKLESAGFIFQKKLAEAGVLKMVKGNIAMYSSFNNRYVSFTTNESNEEVAKTKALAFIQELELLLN